ncbi:hypothetical protein ACMGD3_24370 [Lysinibacillus sphaericus]|uniref:hypothetical protein n=1 Tax=Lysinibacillus sphaericus TaxID=1421 RepID=UPI003F79FA42
MLHLELEIKIIPVYEKETNVIEPDFVSTFKVEYLFCDNKVAENYIQVINTTPIVDALENRQINHRSYLAGIDKDKIFNENYKSTILLDVCFMTLQMQAGVSNIFKNLLSLTKQEIKALDVVDGDKKTIAVIHPMFIEQSFPKYKDLINFEAINAITTLLRADNSIDFVTEVEESVYSLNMQRLVCN